MKLIGCVLLLCSQLAIHAQQDVAYSKLWGKEGEAWDTARIPDFTKAGYKQGEALPVYPVRITLRGKGDGQTDNTAVLRQAIAACGEKGAVYIPAGVYVITDTILIRKNGICIRGEGKERTTLLFKKGIEELYPFYNISNVNQTKWSWSGAMLLFAGTQNSGIENISVEFPDSSYHGHDFHERGYNAIGFKNDASDGWVNNVRMVNADMGIWIESGSHHITAQQWELVFGPIRRAQEKSGHHGVNIYGGYNLLQDFSIDGKYVHDLSVESAASVFNVFRNGRGKDLCIDHHNHAQSHNLFTNLDAGEGTRLYVSGGKTKPRGISFHETYWNITAKKNMNYCDQHNSADLQSRDNVAVGIKTARPSDTVNGFGNWFETIDPALLVPKDLYEAQRAVKRKDKAM